MQNLEFKEPSVNTPYQKLHDNINYIFLHFIYSRIEKFNRNTSERIKNTNRKQMCYAVIC